jgi:hypothetical protein
MMPVKTAVAGLDSLAKTAHFVDRQEALLGLGRTR